VESSQVSVSRAVCHFLYQYFNFDAGLQDRELGRQRSRPSPTYPLSLHHARHSVDSLDYKPYWTV
jgi:hypothetical protein